MIKKFIIAWVLNQGLDFVIDLAVIILERDGIKDWEEIVINVLKTIKDKKQ